MSETDSSGRVNLASTTARSLCTVALSEAVLEIDTREPLEFVDLTERINVHLATHGIEHGLITVFSRHTTAAIKINESEELLIEDFKTLLRRLCPLDHRYHHNDMSRRKPPIAPDEHANGHSHCMHLLLSTSETIPVIDTRLALGSWQRVFLVELDGPRSRQVILRCSHYLPLHQFDTVDNHTGNGSPRNGRTHNSGGHHQHHHEGSSD